MPRPRLLLALQSEAPVWSIPREAVEALQRDFPGVAITDARSREAIEAAIADAEILFSWAVGDDLIARARSLRWVHSPAAGVGSYLTPSFRARAPRLTNSRGVHAVPISEHVLGSLIALARGFGLAARDQAAGAMPRDHWWTRATVPRELAGRVLGLYGYGAIGREVARRARAFGMRIVASKRDPARRPAWDPELLDVLGLPAEEPEIETMHGPDPNSFDLFLEGADAVVITAALTPETTGRFDTRAFARMRPDSWLVNVARGKIVREDALIEALRSGRPAAAALDVFEREPLPAESPLYTLENVILTPHVSGLSEGFWRRAIPLFRANLTRYLEGRQLLNEVDLERGY